MCFRYTVNTPAQQGNTSTLRSNHSHSLSSLISPRISPSPHSLSLTSSPSSDSAFPSLPSNSRSGRAQASYLDNAPLMQGNEPDYMNAAFGVDGPIPCSFQSQLDYPSIHPSIAPSCTCAFWPVVPPNKADSDPTCVLCTVVPRHCLLITHL